MVREVFFKPYVLTTLCHYAVTFVLCYFSYISVLVLHFLLIIYKTSSPFAHNGAGDWLRARSGRLVLQHRIMSEGRARPEKRIEIRPIGDAVVEEGLGVLFWHIFLFFYIFFVLHFFILILYF